MITDFYRSQKMIDVLPKGFKSSDTDFYQSFELIFE